MVGDGRAFCLKAHPSSRVRQSQEHLPFAVFGTNVSPERIAAASIAGADGHMGMPLNLPGIFEGLERALSAAGLLGGQSALDRRSQLVVRNWLE